MILGWLIQFCTSLIWMLFALRSQTKWYPNAGPNKKILVGILNFIFCPICILIAVLNPKHWKSEED